MTSGFFHELYGWPMIHVRLRLSRLNIAVDHLFVIDTGADRSVLGARDSNLIGIEYSTLTGSIPAYGIGGTTTVFRESATISFIHDGALHAFSFIHDGALHAFDTEIDIMPPDPAQMFVPSLL